MTRSLRSRRSFLRRAAAVAGVAAFPAVVPRTVLGRLAPSNRIHLAMFGVGNRGAGVMTGFAHQEDARFVVVCDPFKSRRESAAQALANVYKSDPPATTADFREVMARDDVDAVVLCTPDHWHVPLAIAAAQTGKDVYVEKALSPSVAWEQRLREVVQRHRRIVQYGTQQRSSANFRYVCQLVRNGYLGRLKHVDAWCVDGTRARQWMLPASLSPEPVPADLAYDLWLGPAPFQPYNKYRVNREGSFHNYDYSIGFLGGWGAHPLDIAQWGLGADDSGPVEYQGTGKIPSQGLYSTVYDWDVTCRYADDVTMHFMAERIAAPVVARYRKRIADHGTTFFGEEGWISVDRSGIEASDPKLLTVRFKPGDVRLVASPGHDRNFLDCVRSREQPVSPLEAAIRSDTISHLSDIAIRLGRMIRWNTKKEAVVDDDAAQRMLTRPMRPPYQY